MYEIQKNDIYNSESSNVTLVECTKKNMELEMNIIGPFLNFYSSFGQSHYSNNSV